MSRVRAHDVNVLGINSNRCEPDANYADDRAAVDKLRDALLVYPMTAQQVEEPRIQMGTPNGSGDHNILR